MKKLIIIALVLLLSGILKAQEQQVVVPYTLADRDRAIRTEIKVESQQRQLDDIKTLFYWGFGILITLFIFMLGYMIWDRRDYSKKHADLAEILRTHGIL